VVGVEPNAVVQPKLMQVVKEGVDASATVTANEDPATLFRRELSKGVGQDLDVVGGIVRSRLPDPQQASELLTSATGPVVKKRKQRVEAERALPGRGRAFLLRVRKDDRSPRRDRRPQLPDPLPRLRPGLPQRQVRRLPASRRAATRSGRRRPARTSRAAPARLLGRPWRGAQARHAPGNVQHNLARVVTRLGTSPRPQRGRQGVIQTCHGRGLQQRAARRADE